MPITTYIDMVEDKALTRASTDPKCIVRQVGVTWTMRSKLVKCLSQVHYHRKMLPESLLFDNKPGGSVPAI